MEEPLPTYRGFYINLDRCEHRRAHMEQMLQSHGLGDIYQRFPGVDGSTIPSSSSVLKPGEIGCWLSHINVLRSNADSDVDIHVLEDDVILCKEFSSHFGSIRKKLSKQRTKWDLLWTDVILAPADAIGFRFFSAAIDSYVQAGEVRTFNLKGRFFAGMYSILYNRNSLGKIVAILDDGWKSGMPIDIFLREQINAGRLRAFTTGPTLTTSHFLAANSEIREPLTPVAKVAETLRRAFYIHANPSELSAEMEALTQGSQHSWMDKTYLMALGFTLTKKNL